MNEEQKIKRGKIVCAKLVKYDDVASLLKEMKVDEAVKAYMLEEQRVWIHENSTKEINKEFLSKHFSKWTYTLDGKICDTNEINAAIKAGIVWDVDLTVELDHKLKAYKIMKNES